jgi:Domain of unknown function (DUF4381)
MSVDWLAQLAPEHAPPPPAWWPPAPGWWMVAGLVLLAGGALCWRFVSARLAPRRVSRDAALEELERIRRDADIASAAPAIQRLLRRYALTVFERERVAPLTGESWVRFLSEHGATAFAEGDGQGFLSAAYGRPRAPLRCESWLEAAEGFIRQAPRPSAPREPVA